MCGIAGILHFGSLSDAPGRAASMAGAIRHRGPDGEGTSHFADVSLAHVRLSILDIEGGAQPMYNEDGSVAVVFNGEIYNHGELRAELEHAGHCFASSHSDTEVLVHGWEEWGTRLPERLNGMFAFAVWDNREGCLFLARDRYGIKPLYVARVDGAFLFASEVRAFFASGLLPMRPDCDGLLEYLCCQNIWGQNTMFEGAESFPAGCWELYTRESVRRVQYWDVRFPRDSGLDMDEAARLHREILLRVVERQMQSDVPVMTYLSGGIDSSAISAAAHRLAPDMRAYSCIFDLEGVGADRHVDEREFARAVAEHLHIAHTELELPADSLSRCLDDMVRALEYPMMGLAYVNYLIAGRVARDGKVVLSGTGGDELHAGYVNRYHALPDAPRPPGPLSRLAGLFRGTGPGSRPLDPGFSRFNVPLAVGEIRQALTPEVLRMVRAYDPAEAIPGHLSTIPGTLGGASLSAADRVMYLDARTYLHGLLVVEDKLSMAHGLEARVPLLDNELVDFVSTLDFSLLNDGHTGKRVFRESVRPLVPADICAKPKVGFAPPETSWYRGALRPFVERELSPEAVGKTGIFRPEYARRVLDEHFSGRRNRQGIIWSMLNVQAWCRVFGLFGEG